MFSRSKTSQIASAWGSFASSNSDRAADWNAALVAMGLAYPYMKYRNNLSNGYKELGLTAKEQNFGMWQDKIYASLDVNERVVSRRTRRFVPFETPRDCLTGRT